MKTLGYLLFTAFVALSCHKPQNNDMAHESTCDEILQDSIIKNTSPIWFYKTERAYQRANIIPLRTRVFTNYVQNEFSMVWDPLDGKLISTLGSKVFNQITFGKYFTSYGDTVAYLDSNFDYSEYNAIDGTLLFKEDNDKDIEHLIIFDDEIYCLQNSTFNHARVALIRKKKIGENKSFQNVLTIPLPNPEVNFVVSFEVYRTDNGAMQLTCEYRADSNKLNLVTYDLSTGNKVWEKEMGEVHSPPVSLFILDNQLYYNNAFNSLVQLDKSTGNVNWSSAYFIQGFFKPLKYNDKLIFNFYENMVSTIKQINASDGTLYKSTILCDCFQTNFNLNLVNDYLFTIENGNVIRVMNLNRPEKSGIIFAPYEDCFSVAGMKEGYGMAVFPNLNYIVGLSNNSFFCLKYSM